MKIAVLTFDGFNELDSFIAFAMLNRVSLPGWKAEITAPTSKVTSKNGMTVDSQKPLSFANEADVVLFGSGINSRRLIEDDSIMSQFDLSPEEQLIGSQCSGALFLHKLGLLKGAAVCTDSGTRVLLEDLGAQVLNRPFTENGNIASAGGCLSSHYLATWVISRKAGLNEAKDVIRYFAPVGQEEEYLARAVQAISNETQPALVDVN